MQMTDSTPQSEVQKTITVENKMGIHARPAAMIVRVANKFKAEIFFEKDDEVVNGKSIMGLMMLAAGKGSQIKLTASGDDAAEACEEIEKLFAGKFDEKSSPPFLSERLHAPITIGLNRQSLDSPSP